MLVGFGCPSRTLFIGLAVCRLTKYCLCREGSAEAVRTRLLTDYRSAWHWVVESGHRLLRADTKMPVIVTTLRLPEAATSLLGEVGELRGPEDWQSHLDQAEAIISLVTTRVDAAVLEKAPALRIVANAGVGYDNVDVPA